jgi:hypothetical protein
LLNSAARSFPGVPFFQTSGILGHGTRAPPDTERDADDWCRHGIGHPKFPIDKSHLRE